MKPHTFAQMVNEVRDLAFDFGTSEQFRDRVADLLGKYIHVEHNSKGVPEQAEAPAVVVPERAAWLTIDEMEKVILNVTLHLPVKGTGMPRYIASKIAEASRAKGIRAIPADRVLGEGIVAVRWITVSESLPEDGESVGFVINSPRDEWNHGRAVGGRFNRKHFDKGFGGFSFPGIEWAASHWCKLPPIPDTIRANQGGAGNARV